MYVAKTYLLQADQRASINLRGQLRQYTWKPELRVQLFRRAGSKPSGGGQLGAEHIKCDDPCGDSGVRVNTVLFDGRCGRGGGGAKNRRRPPTAAREDVRRSRVKRVQTKMGCIGKRHRRAPGLAGPP
jgi:hypothetical protein